MFYLNGIGDGLRNCECFPSSNLPLLTKQNLFQKTKKNYFFFTISFAFL